MGIQIIRMQGKDKWVFSDSLQIQNVGQIVDQIKQSNSLDKTHVIDVSSVTSCDTAGIQLLCVIMAECERNGWNAKMTPVPECILDIANQIGVKFHGME
jgi:ABC-type transporter Mla MlaB component